MEQAKARREEAIQCITGMLQENPFSFEIKPVKRPRGIRITLEMTREQFDQIMDHKIELNYENK